MAIIQSTPPSLPVAMPAKAAAARAPASAPAASMADSYTPSAPPAAEADYASLVERPTDARFEQLRLMVATLLERQGIEVGELAQMSQAEAQAAIAEDGYWGVEQTADRIFQFAVSAAGGDVAKLDQLRAAVQKGYDEALQAFGGELPEISQQTMARVFEKFDQWAEQNQPAEAQGGEA